MATDDPMRIVILSKRSESKDLSAHPMWMRHPACPELGEESEAKDLLRPSP
jgi:hypothetical protein